MAVRPVFDAITRFVKDLLPGHIVRARSAVRYGQPISRSNGVAAHELLEAGPIELRPLGFQEFLSLEIPPRQMLLSPILPEKSLSMLYAPRGIGKTPCGRFP